MKYTYFSKKLFLFIILAFGLGGSVFSDFTPQTDPFPHGEGIIRYIPGTQTSCATSAQYANDPRCNPGGLNDISFNNYVDMISGGEVIDERRFLDLSNSTTNPDVYSNIVTAKQGDTIWVSGLVHNNGYLNDPNLIATNVLVGMNNFNKVGEGMYETHAAETISLEQFIYSGDATPKRITDDALVKSGTSGKKIKLVFDASKGHKISAQNVSGDDGSTIYFSPSAFFSSGGFNMGSVKACSPNAYYTYASFTVVEVEDPDPIDLEITKSVSPIKAAPGSTVNYTLTYKNNSDTTATNIIVKDFQESYLENVSNINAPGMTCTTENLGGGDDGDLLNSLGTGVSEQLRCIRNSLSKNDGPQSITYTAQIKSTAPNDEVVDNHVNIRGQESETNTDNNTASASVTVETESIDGVCSSTNAHTYSFTDEEYTSQTNAGFCDQGTAKQGTLTYSQIPFPQPGGTESWICEGVNEGSDSEVCTATRDAEDLTCSISATPTSIQEGSSSTLSWTSTGGTSATLNQDIGTVQLSGSKVVSPQTNTTYTLTVSRGSESVQCSTSVAVSEVQTPPDLEIVKTANPISTTPGSIVSYTLQYKNVGSTAATDIIIKDFFDSHYLENVTITNDGPASCSIVDYTPDEDDFLFTLPEWNNKIIRCTRGNLSQSDGPEYITYTGRVKSTTPNNTTVYNQALITASNEPQDKLDKNVDHANVLVAVPDPTASDVRIGKSVTPATAKPGDTVNYTLEYENLSDTTATNIIIKDFYDTAHLENVTITDDGAATCQLGAYTSHEGDYLFTLPSGTNQIIRCTRTNLSKSDGKQYIRYSARIKSTTPDDTNVDNQVVITASNEDQSKLSNNISQARVVVDIPVTAKTDVRIGKSVTPTTAKPGDTVSYTLEYENLSDIVANDIIIKDFYDTVNLENITITDPGSASCALGSYTTNSGDYLFHLPSGVNDIIRCTRTSLSKSDGKQYIRYTGRIKVGTANNTPVRNQVVIMASNEDQTKLANNIASALVTVNTDTSVINGTCSTTYNNKTFSANHSGNYSSRTDTAFCATGTPSPAASAIPFPGKGQTVTWQCLGSGTGATSSTCKVSRLDDNDNPNLYCSITPSTQTVKTYSNATFSWTSVGATSATFDQGIGKVPVNGSKTVSVPFDKTYTLTVKNNAGETATCKVRVNEHEDGWECKENSEIDLGITKYIKTTNGVFVPASTESTAAALSSGANSVVYKIVVSNAGDVSAYDTKIKDTFTSANGFTLTNISNISGAKFDAASNIFTIDGVVPANGSKEITYSAVVNARQGVGRNTVRIESFTFPFTCPNLVKQKGVGRTATTYVKSGTYRNLQYMLDKRVNKKLVKGGDTVIYTLLLRNKGETPLKNVVLYDRFPAEYLEPLDKSALSDTRTLKFHQALVPVDGEMKIKVHMKVKENIEPGTNIRNILTASSDTIEINESDEEIITVEDPNLPPVPRCPEGTKWDKNKNLCLVLPSNGFNTDIPFLPIGSVLLGLVALWRRDDLIRMFT